MWCFCSSVIGTVAQRLTSIHLEIPWSNFQLDLRFFYKFLSLKTKLHLMSTNLPLSKRVRSLSVCQPFRSRWPAPHTQASTISPSDTLLCTHDVGKTVLEDTGGGNGVCVRVHVCVCVCGVFVCVRCVCVCTSFCVCMCACVHVSSVT